MSNKATPKTLIQAIENGADDAKAQVLAPPIDVIRDHVRDLLSQKFGAAMLSAPTDEESARLKALFQRILEG